MEDIQKTITITIKKEKHANYEFFVARSSNEDSPLIGTGETIEEALSDFASSYSRSVENLKASGIKNPHGLIW